MASTNWKDMKVNTLRGELTEMYAVIAEGEGIVAGLQPPLPLVTYDRRNVDGLLKIAAEVAAATGKTLYLVRFSNPLVQVVLPSKSWPFRD